MALPFRIASRPPDTATGTIGACALIAMMKPPFLKGKSSSVRLRVPSGKIRNELPLRIDAAARSMASIASSCCSRVTGTKPPVSMTMPRIGSLPQLGLEQDVQAAVQAPGRAPAGPRCSGGWSRTPRRDPLRHAVAPVDTVADAGQAERQRRRRCGRARRARPSSFSGTAMASPSDAGQCDVEGNDDVGDTPSGGPREGAHAWTCVCLLPPRSCLLHSRRFRRRAAARNRRAAARPAGASRSSPSAAASCRARCRSRGRGSGSRIRSKSLFALISSFTTSSVLYGGTLLSIVPCASSSLPFSWCATSWLAWLS